MVRSIFLTAFLGILCSINIYAQDKKTIKSTPQQATIFFKGAELTHSFTTSLTRGDNEIWVQGLGPNVDQNSIRVSTTGGVLVSSFTFTVDYLAKPSSPSVTVKKWQDSLSVCQDELRAIQDNLETIEEVLDLLKENKDISGNEKATVTDLIQMTDYYKAKSTELLKERRVGEKKKKTLDETVYRLQSQINQEVGKGTKTENFLKLQLMSPSTLTSTVKIVYYTNNASWTPYYDINVKTTDNPIQFTSKAKVRQTTGIDWSKVKLTLSTAAPSRGKTAPLFSTWFLDYMRAAPVAVYADQMEMAAVPMAQNSLSYRRSEKAMAGGAAMVPTEPVLIVNGTVMPGSKLSDIDASMIKSVNELKGKDAAAIYGSQASAGAIVVTLKSSMDDYVVRDENQMNMTYNIDIPYSMQGNGKEENITLQTFDVPAEFKYYCAPKLDTETFVVAEISDWEKLGLLSGKANLTYDGTYVGETTINASSTQEKFSLTLGTDKRVTVKRELLTQFSSKKTFGNDIKQEFAYKITVRNNQSKTISMVVKDQYPISTQKNINVELSKETTAPTFNNEDVGVLSWEFELKPGETREFRNAYSVKYPKNETINL